MIPYDLRIQHDEMGNAPHLLSEADTARLEAGDYYRASGNVVCTCGRLYYDHPPLVGALWLNVLCDGSFVKL